MSLIHRKRKTLAPCPRCRLHKDRCICAFIPSLTLKTKLSLIVHAKELKRTTNSGRLAIEALTNSQMLIRGETKERLDLSSLILPDYDNYVLFPAEDAVDIGTIKNSRPVHLIVSDGNWRQASKLNSRHPELNSLPRVTIKARNTSQYHLRKEHFQEGLSTLEAIALAIRSIEGIQIGDQLLDLYQRKLKATLIGRGHKIED